MQTAALALDTIWWAHNLSLLAAPHSSRLSWCSCLYLCQYPMALDHDARCRRWCGDSRVRWQSEKLHIECRRSAIAALEWCYWDCHSSMHLSQCRALWGLLCAEGRRNSNARLYSCDECAVWVGEKRKIKTDTCILDNHLTFNIFSSAYAFRVISLVFNDHLLISTFVLFRLSTALLHTHDEKENIFNF